jgi:penicillin-binding protein 1A
MGYPGKKKPLGNDMTGGHGALPFFIDFMKTFLKDKEKEDFPKAPNMPEDMKELFRQRQRELAAERAELAAEAEEEADEKAATSTGTEPKMDQVTLPPPPKAESSAPEAQPKAEPPTPKPEAAPPAATRPREAEPAKKKGKKGDGEPG